MGTDDDDTEVSSGEQATTAERAPSRGVRPLRITGDRYRVSERIGRGGMGDVLSARDEQLGRDVAIKRLRAADPSERQIARFLREARIQGRLEHPAIVPVHELGRDVDGLPFFAMKKLAGTTLAEILDGATHSRQRLLRAFADVCLAVEFAHVHGVIHRDLKPENIALGEFGEVYVLDWGVARVADEADDFEDLRSDGPHTVAGAVIGTLAYMSPEQARDSRDVDERTDVFALGRVLGAVLACHADPPPELVALAEHATAEDRGARIGSARELGEEVQRYLDGDRDLELRRKLARDHFEQARAAVAGGLHDDDRRVAIRAASSAMALDPTLTGAAELVGRLMLEPPREMPPEVERKVESEEVEVVRAQSWGVLWANATGLFVLVPLMIVTGAWRAALVYGPLVAFATVSYWRGVRDPSAKPPPSWALAIGNAAGIGLLAHAFSPPLLAPAIAVLVAVQLAANPFLMRPLGVALTAALLATAIVGPAVAEQLGLIRSTVEVTADGGLLFHAPARFAGWMVLPITSLYAIAMVALATVLGRLMRAQERKSRRQLHLQAWQLRQLVADPLA
jgi:serine/threonine-protein kinase